MRGPSSGKLPRFESSPEKIQGCEIKGVIEVRHATREVHGIEREDGGSRGQGGVVVQELKALALVLKLALENKVPKHSTLYASHGIVAIYFKA